jgi:ADP-ribose diphosphatase
MMPQAPGHGTAAPPAEFSRAIETCRLMQAPTRQVMSNRPEILRRTLVASTRLFRVEEIALRFSNGIEVVYERLRASDRGAVLIVPVADPDTILLINEYSAGTDSYELGFPKGRIDGEESILDAAQRELREDVGNGARRLEHIRTVTLAPGYFGHTTHIVLAQDLYADRLQGDEPEPIEVIPWSLSNFDELMARSDFTEARSIMALYMARAALLPGDSGIRIE